jgi:hypothetical protein
MVLRRKVAPCTFSGVHGQLLNQKFSEIEENMKSLEVSWANVLFVAKGGGDFTSIQEALDYAERQTPTLTNQWLIVVMPGKYVEQLELVDYVNIIGLGTQEDTIVSYANEKVIIPAVCILSNITIEQTGTPASTDMTLYCNASCSLDEEYPTTNYHNTSQESPGHITIHAYGEGPLITGIFGFDFASIPTGVTITNAVGYFYNNNTNMGADNFYLNGCMRNVVDTLATYNTYNGFANWTIGGGRGVGTDIDVSAETLCSGTSAPGWNTASMTALTQLCKNNGYQFLHAHQHSGMGHYPYISPDGAIKEPYIVVSYSPSTMDIITGNTKQITLLGCRLTGVSGVSIAINTNSSGNITLENCKIDSVLTGLKNTLSATLLLKYSSISASGNHISNSSSGTINSYYNIYSGAGTHLVRSDGTVNSLADKYDTTSGTIILLGNVDKVDGMHASDFATAVHTHTKSQVTDLETITTTPTASAVPKANGSNKIANGWLNTGSGNGLDADTVDGSHASAFSLTGHNHDGVYGRWRGSSGSAPSDPLAMDVYYDTGDSNLYMYDGSAWRQIT